MVAEVYFLRIRINSEPDSWLWPGSNLDHNMLLILSGKYATHITETLFPRGNAFSAAIQAAAKMIYVCASGPKNHTDVGVTTIDQWGKDSTIPDLNRTTHALCPAYERRQWMNEAE